MAEELKEVVISPSGGLNQDTSILNPRPSDRGNNPYLNGDYKYALNLRIGSSTEDNIGATENIPSTYNTQAYFVFNGSTWQAGSPPSGVNTAISKKEDVLRGRVFWFVHNDLQNYTILMFSKYERVTYELLRWTGLNFFTYKHISSCIIDKYLIFCDDNNPNRIINIDEIHTLKSTLGANFSEYHISFHKWSPLAPPLSRRNVAGTSEYTKKGIFQFRYRYIYKGGFKSTWSPPGWFVTNEFNASDLALNLKIPGFFFNYEAPSSTSFQHSSVKFYEFVQYIELAYRESTRDTWKLFKRHTVTSGNNEDFEFSNNGPSALIPSIEINEYFDSVPFLSKACESIDNRVMFGNNKDELPAVTDFDVENIEVYSRVPGSDTWHSPSTDFSSLTGPQQVALGQIQAATRMSFKERAIYKLGIVFQHYSGRTNLATTLDKWTYLIPNVNSSSTKTVEAYHALGFNIPLSVTPPDWAVAYQIVRSNALKIELFIHGVANDFRFLANDDNGVTDYISTPTSVKEFTNEYFGNPVSDTLRFLNKKKFDLIDRALADQRKNKEVTIDNASRIYIDISNWFLTAAKDDPPTMDWPANSANYSFLKGDRVRFKGSLSAAYSGSDLTEFDEEIVEFTGKGIIVNKPSNLVTLKKRTDSGSNPERSYIIEIYRPSDFSDQSNVTFYEMGEWYPITQPTTSSRDFSKRDFRWTDPASVTVSTVNGHTIYNKMPIINGDVWVVPKDFYYNKKNAFTGQMTGYVWPQMNQDKSRAWDFWEHNTGREYTAYNYLPVEQYKKTQVRFGGKFLEDSFAISINTFRGLDQEIYPSEYGPIRSLVNTANAQVESVGAILLTIAEIEAWSIYVNRRTLEDLNGQTSVEQSAKVLGSYNVLLGQKGTLNPESVSVKNGRVIWWNAVFGEWLRYSRDGLTDISEEGMKNWFKDLADLIINYYYDGGNPPRVVSTFDQYHKCWMVYHSDPHLPATFKGYSSYKCTTFAERNADKKWKEFFDYTPEVFASLGNEVYSIIGSNIYIHEEGSGYGSIYGVKKDSILELVAVPEPLKNKSWKALALEASDMWSFESITGDWRSNGGTQQVTRMQTDDLQKKEWTFWTHIKNDKNTPNASSEQAGVVNGEQMRSKSLRILMKLDPAITYYSVFNYLILKYNDSPVNPKS